MRKYYYYLIATCIELAVVNWSICASNAQTTTNMPPLPLGFASRADYVKSFTNEDDAMRAYQNGLIDKGEAMVAHFQIENLKSKDFYGRVIDQYGQPVTNADVIGNIALEHGWSAPEKFEMYKTQTDAEGLFQFTGLHGAKLGVVPSKPGYELGGHGEGYKGSVGQQSSPTDRVTFNMWKLHGAEPMVHPNIHAYIPCDGSIAKFNLITGKQDPNGELIVSLTRNPVNIDRSKPFNWSVTLEIQNGGLQEITNIYPNEAPVEGYQPIITLDFQTNLVGWQPQFNRAYYFKSQHGQVYGRMTINIMANFQPPPTLFDVEIYANPAGSRNLEFDYKKQTH
jgi:hypothetical protein